MYKTRILIISNRKELSAKLKKLIENLAQSALYTNDLSYALKIIQSQEIEFIIISDTIKEKLSSFIEKIRVLTYNFRPIIIAISKSSDLKDRLEVLEHGADDVIGEEISKSEFQMRFMAHLRRYIESYLNPITGIYDKYITHKAIRQSLAEDNNYSYLLIKIKNALTYRTTHGEIAWEKAIKTLSAIINSALSKDDYIGHISDDEFILITNPMIAEQIASFLTFAFDNILNKFYSEDEFSNNFTMEFNDNKEENKKGLMRLNIAVCEKNNQKLDYRLVLNNLYETLNLLKETEKSIYLIDRAKIQGEVSSISKNKVLVYEQDEALSYLLKNVCELNNIIVKTVFEKTQFQEEYGNFKPDVVILDWGNKNESTSLDIAKQISKDNIKLIFSSSYLNKKEILKSGADLYIPKPYEIDDMINWIKKFLN
ncbi:MAG: diguanylate cyclase [Candidatus Gastranaerophilales bacterium]|nr:diguanylate cyclase [Candidatus Gastranaerophilales bacterium]